MDNNHTNFQNLKALRRCETIYKDIFLFYFCTCVPYALGSLVFGIFGLGNTLFVVFVGILLTLVIGVLGILGCYAKNDIFCLMATIASLIGFVVSQGSPVQLIICIGSAACTVITIITNKKYRKLEKLEGFPYFNERVDAANEAFRSGKDKYKERYEEPKSKNLPSDMDDLVAQSSAMPDALVRKNDYMDDI